MTNLFKSVTLKDLAISFMCAAIGTCALLVGLTAWQFQATARSLTAATAGMAADVHATTTQLITSTVQVQARLNHELDNTMPLVNANLIHSDLVLGDFQRVSDLQEGYWKTSSDQVSSSFPNKKTRAHARKDEPTPTGLFVLRQQENPRTRAEGTHPDQVSSSFATRKPAHTRGRNPPRPSLFLIRNKKTRANADGTSPPS